MLKVIKVPNPILTKRTSIIEKIDDEILNLVGDMIEACRKANGIVSRLH